MTFEERGERLVREIDSLRPVVEDVAKSLYENPELGLQEVFAVSKLTGILESKGFHVETEIAGMPTAFKAQAWNQGPRIAFLAEYDALPEIGHGCGHNLMAAVALAAGIGLKNAFPPEEARATWLVLGTPAEETIGGKVVMAEAGVFSDIDAAFIAHPGQLNSLGGSSWASHPIEIAFRGRTAHAGGNPQEGINALDACVSAYTAIRMMKNHLRDDVRLAGIITHGGDAPNIVPDRAVARFTVRSKSSHYLEEVVLPKVRQIAEGAAAAIGATVEFRHYEPLFKETLEHPVLRELARKNFEYLGQELPEMPRGGGGVTDVGSVTWETPCIQIGFSMTDARGHSREMAADTIKPRAIDATLMAAKVLALSAMEFIYKPELLKQAKDYLEQARRDQN
ncbi:MAG: amidohydrolase [Bacillota bacterium]|nr:M20 family metallopeptidase [Candidatus Fermentithermobacillaceae bacterium]